MEISFPGFFAFALGGKPQHWVKLGWYWRAAGDAGESATWKVESLWVPGVTLK